MFGKHCALFDRRQTRGLPQSEDYRASNGWHRGVKVHRRRRRIHNPDKKMGTGSGLTGPDGLTPPTEQSPEEKPKGCTAGRDAVRIGEIREVKSAGWNPQDPLPKFFPEPCFDGLGPDGQGASASV